MLSVTLFTRLQFAPKTRYVLALILGATVTLSLAPFKIWPLGIVSPALFALLLLNLSAKQAFKTAWFFGLGMFLSGVSWVYVAIHDFGYTGVPLAIVMTATFVATLALVFAAPFYLYGLLFTESRFKISFVFPAIWVLGEWYRGWLLTGFPWLYLGYAHTDTWLSGWAPIIGVFGLSFLTVLTGTIAIQIIANKTLRTALSSVSSLIAVWLGGYLLQDISWTAVKKDAPVSVAIIQPNIDLEMKWDPRFSTYIIEILLSESSKHWDKDIVIWPEAAIPFMFDRAQPLLGELNEIATQTNTSFITGILYDQQDPVRYYNSIIGLGLAEGMYFKQRLVPFGEYVPLEEWLRGLIHFFDLPNSVIHAGPKNQQGLFNDAFEIAPFICYEIVYPDLVAKNNHNAEVLVTISNDAWFGESIGPIQHLQMTQMRALENGKYVMRGTNTGVSAVIDTKGQVIATGMPYTQTSFATEIYRAQGTTPFATLRSYPIVLFCFVILIIVSTIQIVNKRKISNIDPAT